MTYIIGTRGSKLALWQAETVKGLLEKAHPEVTFELKIIHTSGDLDQKTPLNEMGGVGLFTKQIELALENKDIDIAVHSYKDMPSVVDEKFEMAAVLKREKINDIFISDTHKIADMENGINVGTGSLRRISQLKSAFPKINTMPLRGNVDTRLRKLKEGQYDAIILAYAGVKRLGLLDGLKYELIPEDINTPAVAQGAVAIEIRKNEPELKSIIRSINHKKTEVAVDEERTFLRIVEGGCKVPVACYGRFIEDEFVITGFIGNLDGTQTLTHTMVYPDDSFEDAGRILADFMLKKGGKEILDSIK